LEPLRNSQPRPFIAHRLNNPSIRVWAAAAAAAAEVCAERWILDLNLVAVVVGFRLVYFVGVMYNKIEMCI
jgi:hypothetical protein